ncbi:homocysteine S-methyltransferase [Desulfocicer vacuolatum DSM 3385]|uniref:Methylenetetrahydrofolate reductase n=1 Tax=Desulfocicer vacuolatum DSM 3385 TaxID=1121400 RepID=A0A1W2B7Y7_9BACT|nr:methylenetetrahydrofolate reductase [Desulfocicer vacuolatum]SMC69143.1 homocysteine S-methyltransferase [Desulfocicer vacuolatum DSM 3385]
MNLTENLGKKFVITTELGPVKGVLADKSLEKAGEYLSLDGINIHDCPMGNLRINSVAMASLVQNKLGIEAVPHFTCRDRSLLGTQADLLGAHALGIRNILVTTGDPPKHGPYPSKPVYDYSTFELIRLIRKMNSGLDYNEKEFGGKTDFKIACTAMPTARNPERELERMKKKISAGADFFQSQVVYDSEKAVSFLREARKLGKPILTGVMPLKSVKMARFMNKNVEGIDVPEEVISRMENDGADGIEITCDFIKEIAEHTDGIHIMAMGDVKGTNRIIEFVNTLVGR